jgi:hypothetical protein
MRPIGGLAHHGEGGFVGQQVAQSLAEHGVVVH